MHQDRGTYVAKVSGAKAELWKKLRQKLKHIDIELTERCNNKCVHCYINVPENDDAAYKKELSTKEIKNILKQAQSLGCLSVRYTGGEPMLREDFNELYIFAKRLGMRVIIFTNATLIDEEKISLFQRYKPGIPIEVTVYGMRQESYEAVSRIHGSYKAAFRGIELLLKNNIPFIVKSSFLPQNKDDVEQFEEWAATIPWMDHKPTYSMNFDLRARRDSEDVNKRIKKLRASPMDNLALAIREPEKYYKSMQDFCSKFTSPPGDKLFSCGAGQKSATIDAYGNVQVCILVRHPDTVYNVRKGSLEDAIDNFFPAVLAMRAKNKDYLQKCAKCFLKGLCQQCPGRSWAEHGTLDARVPYYCEITHAQGRWLGLLGENEWAWEVKDWRQRLDEFVNKEFSRRDQ